MFIGANSGEQIVTGFKNICIGSDSGPSSDSDNNLYIDIEQSDDPLIYGEFDNDHVKINGTFEVTAGLTNPSSIHLKDIQKAVNSQSILDKVSQLELYSWTYKTRPDEIHIGPTAEDFYSIFGTGGDETKISTIDADGVALASIKALKIENEELRKMMAELQHQLNELKE